MTKKKEIAQYEGTIELLTEIANITAPVVVAPDKEEEDET